MKDSLANVIPIRRVMVVPPDVSVPTVRGIAWLMGWEVQWSQRLERTIVITWTRETKDAQ